MDREQRPKSDEKTGNRRRSGLGRGLGALIVNTEAQTPVTSQAIGSKDGGGPQFVPVDQILPNPHQPRTQFDAEPLAELAASIRTHGIIQPLIVTQIPEPKSNTPVSDSTQPEPQYWLVAGERRWRAARLADLTEVPVIVREASPQQLMEWALVENVQRADLNPLEEAAAYQVLINEFGLTQTEIAERVGKSRSAVANTVRLQQLSAEVQAALISNRVSAGHARALLAFQSDHHTMNEVLEQIQDQDLNVRQTEAIVRQRLLSMSDASVEDVGENELDEGKASDPLHVHLANLENNFRDVLGTRVSLNRGEDGRGRLVIHFYNDEDLENLYQQIVGSHEM